MSYTPLANTIFSGDARAVTPSAADNDTSIATTAFVQGELGGYLALTGGTMTGDITLSASTDINFNDTSSGLQWSDVRIDRTAADVISLASGDQIRVQQDPVNDNDLTRKAYVDAIASGLDWKDSVEYVTVAALPANTRTGNTLDADANGALTVDGIAVSAGDHILVKDEGNEKNGIYTVDDAGSAGTPWAMTRRSDADADAEVTAGLAVFVTEGSTKADTGWVLTTDDPITVNTTTMSFSNFSSATVVTSVSDLSDVDTSGAADHSILWNDAGTWKDSTNSTYDDSVGLLSILIDGSGGGLVLGSGGDVNLYRSAADTLKTDDDLAVGSSILLDASTGQIESLIDGSGGGLVLGSGGDVNLYRSAADTLKTDDAMDVAGKMTMGAGVNYAVTTKTVNYSVNLATDYVILADNSADTVDLTITLPASHTSGDVVYVKDIAGNAASGTNQVLIATADADTIDGSASDFELTVDYQSVTLVSDGTNWHVI